MAYLLVPSHKAKPIRITQFPEWPFLQICANFFAMHSHTYLIIADRHSGWVTIYYFKWRDATTSSIEMIFRELFITFGVPDELSTDGGPQFTANSFKMFSETWGVQHQKSSVEYPQSNGRAEIAVKSAKRIIYNNTGTNDSLDNNNAAQAILQYHNTPLQDCNLGQPKFYFIENYEVPSQTTHSIINSIQNG